jgi:hypothetical protein
MTRWWRCPHSNLRGVYGDEINQTPGGRRLQCRDCQVFLDGPVALARIRDSEREMLEGL